MHSREQLSAAFLKQIFGIGIEKFKKLENCFGSLEKAVFADTRELTHAGISEKLSEAIKENHKKYPLAKIAEGLGKNGIEVILWNDKKFPRLLLEISNPPAVLFVRGNDETLPMKSIAIVGSRKLTAYGQRAAESFSRELARAGLSIVSGLALGIDSIAHRGALEENGATVAVLGSGINDDSIFPRYNFNLAKEIIENGGAIISEYPPGTPPLKMNFPARNRIMAGLAVGLLVVEAAANSGSLITAGNSLEFGREIFAIPGDIFSPTSVGTNELVRQGAKIACSTRDILEELNIKEGHGDNQVRKIFAPRSAEEEKIWKTLSHEPVHIDTIAKITRLNPVAANSALSMMEIEGAVKDIGGKNYIKC